MGRQKLREDDPYRYYTHSGRCFFSNPIYYRIRCGRYHGRSVITDLPPRKAYLPIRLTDQAKAPWRQEHNARPVT